MADVNLVIELEFVNKPNIKAYVQGFDGTESISQLFSFRVYAATTSNDLDAASLVGERVKLKVTTPCGHWLACGLCTQIDELDPTATEERVLQFTIKPRFAVEQLVVENRIFGPAQPVSVDDVVKQEIGRAPIAIPAEYNLDTYPKRNYVVQYNESDFAFISRLCERDGIFYFFKQEDDGDTVVFADKNLAFPKVKFGSKSSILYLHRRDRSMARSPDDPAVLAFGERRALSSKTIKLRDYNETVPSVISGDKDAGQGNAFLGKVEWFGGYFLDEGAATRLARIRAERIAAEQTVYVVETDAPELRAGVIFQMQGHPRFDGEYLVISASHSAFRPGPIGFEAVRQDGRSYRNSLQCIRSDVPYRPPLATAVPLGYGLHTAKVDGEAWNGRAEIDSQGRYKLQLTFIDEAAARGRGSDYVRKIEPYAGPSQTGLHFPLVAGTEVLVAYVNGDIDRPIIVGAVHNPDMANLVTAGSNLFNKLRSQAGGAMEIFDGPV
jgi:type VI secretion system secreted protein VgrG